MPKSDNLRVINSRTNGRMHASIAGAIYSGDGMADTLDGYDASKQPGPSLIPVSLADGKLDPGWLPEQASSGAGASATGGQVYVAPWVRLARAINETDTTIYLNGAIHAVDDQAVLGHYQYGNEGVTITGGPTQQGTLYEYTITRSATPRAYPAGSTVVFNLGSASDGGYITMVSGDQQQSLTAPHINLNAYENGVAVRKVRIGRLQGLSAGEKAQFPKVDDWNVYGLYADAAYLRGQIVADSGDIAGDLDVGGTLGVWSGLGRAGVVLGNSEGGHGITLQNREGRPVFGAVSPYEDESGVLNDVAVWIENKGEKGLYYHLDPTTGEYRLEIGVETLIDGQLTAANILAGTGAYPASFTGMRLGAEGLQGYSAGVAQVDLDVQDGRLYFGNREGWLGDQGMTIDARTKPEGTDELEHTIHWYNSSAYGDLVGAAIGSDGPGGWWAFARKRMLDVDEVSAQQVNDFYEAKFSLVPGGTSAWSGKTLSLSASDRVSIDAGGGQTSSFERDRAILPGLTAGNALLHSTDDGLTVGFGTQAAGSAARVVIEQDNRPAFKAQRGDHYMTIALSSYIPAGQQSVLPGGYVMRPNSTIGISQANASAEWIAIQNWLRTHGLQPYTPQLAILANQNMATQYDEGTSGLDWVASAIDATALFPAPLVFDYTEFFYKTSPNSLAWTLSGSPVTQDAIDPAVLATVLGNTLDWFRANGIAEPWLMIDEPPPDSSGDWTQAIEDRVIKFTVAAVAAGWTVGVAVPGPSQLAYWRTKLTPTRWILAAKHERNEYATTLPAAQIWLYNRTNKAAGKPMTGLAQQMRDFGAVGYLHWSGDSSVGTWPLVTIDGLTVTETTYGTQLLEELRLFAETDVPPGQPVYEQWFTTTGNMILNARSGYVLQPSGFPISLGASARPFEHVYAKHLHGALGSQIALVSGSSMYISAWSPVQAVGLELSNTVVYFEQSDLPVGKFLRATNPDDDSWEVVKVLSTGLPAGDWWEYELERGLGGLQQFWPEGTTWVDLGGNAADGYVRMWGADDEDPDTGPAMGIWQRDNDDAYDSTSLRFLAGNLNGFYDFGANTWGMAAGRHAGKWFSVTDEGGLRIMDADTQRAVYREYAQIGNPAANNVLITDSSLALGTGDIYTITMDSGGDMDLTGTLAVATGGAITWAGGKGRMSDLGFRYEESVASFLDIRPSAFSAMLIAATNAYTYSIYALNTAAAGFGLYVSAENGAIAIKAVATGTSTTALQIDGGIVDGGSQRYTALADATAATDALNRQTGDARYAPIGGAHAAITLNAAADTVLGLSTQQLTLDTQTANYVWAGPTTGAAATPTFRALVAADIPAGWVLATGATAGATAQTQTFNYGLVVNETSNDSDSRFEGNGDANLLFIDAGTDRVGIGNAAPAHKLHVTGDAYITTNVGIGATPTTAAALQIQKTGDASVAASFGADVVGISSVGGAFTINGMRLIAYNNSTTAQTGTVYGVESAAFNLSSGTASAIIGNRTTIGALSTGNVTNAYALSIGAPVIGSSGVIDTAYGIYISAQKVTGVTTGIGLWQQGASDLNYMNSEIGFNSANWGLGQVHIIPKTASRKGLVVRGFTAQSVAMIETQDPATGNPLTYIAGDGGLIVNEQGGNVDSRIEGDTDVNLTFWDASADMVGIGTNAPSAKLDINSDTLRLRTARTPASATAAGNAGDICWDASYVYFCTATNVWRRAAHATW